ncbi:MAG TPA: hypothetical protein VKW06_16440 [Candidatus Angelobacter sp.]|nr:hypothetical protein [Candidatus Angelobacter sp.]
MKNTMGSIVLVVTCSLMPIQTNTTNQRTAKNDNQGTIHIGIDLRLGMSKELVISSLAPMYLVQKIEDQRAGSSSWFIKDKGSPSEVEGAITFQNEKLTTVTRYWDPTHDTGYDFATALYGATANFKSENRVSCVLDTEARENPRSAKKAVFLKCGDKTLEVAINEFEADGKTTRVVNVMETLGQSYF